MASLQTCWPALDGAKPMRILALRVHLPVDELFTKLYLQPDVQAQLHKIRNDANFAESAWFASKVELPEPAYTWESPPQAPGTEPGSATHRYRKVRFDSPPSALATKPFQNEESQQISVRAPGRRYIVEAVNLTTAPYGDKFKIWLRTVMSHESAATSTLLVEIFVEFLPSMSRMMKPVISKAIEGGVRGTFKIFRQVLEGKATCEDLKDAEAVAISAAAAVSETVSAAAAPAPVPAAAAPAAVMVAAAPPVQLQPSGNITSLPRRKLVSTTPMEGALFFLSDQLISGDQVTLLSELIGTSLRSLNETQLVAKVLALLLTLSLVHVAVGALRSMRVLCAAHSRLLSPMCVPMAVLHLPESTCQVLASLVLVAVINMAVVRASKAGVAYILYYAPRAAVARSQDGAASGSGGGSRGEPVTPPPGSFSTLAVGPQAPSPKSAPSTSAAAPAASLGSAFGALFSGAPRVSGGGDAKANDGGALPADNKPRRAAPPARPHAFPRPPPVVRGVAGASTGSGTGAKETEMSTVTGGTTKAAANVAAAAAAASAQVVNAGVAAVQQSGDEKATPSENTLVPSDAEEDGEGSGGILGSAPTTVAAAAGKEGKKQQAQQDMFANMFSKEGLDSMAESFKSGFGGLFNKGEAAEGHGMKRSASDKALHKEKDGGSPAPVASTLGRGAMADLARISTNGKSGTGDAPNSDGTTSATVQALPMSADVGKGMAHGPANGRPMPAHPEDDQVVVEEEVYENERFQPFRGWGHLWPGHFLPSDRVGHWSDRQGGPGNAESMVFDRVAPKLPVGWKWVEEDWEVDMEGYEVEAVDHQGWTYALDFYLLKYPPPPTGGKCTLKHFVRRRRLFRTRVRVVPLHEDAAHYHLNAPPGSGMTEYGQDIGAFVIGHEEDGSEIVEGLERPRSLPDPGSALENTLEQHASPPAQSVSHSLSGRANSAPETDIAAAVAAAMTTMPDGSSPSISAHVSHDGGSSQPQQVGAGVGQGAASALPNIIVGGHSDSNSSSVQPSPSGALFSIPTKRSPAQPSAVSGTLRTSGGVDVLSKPSTSLPTTSASHSSAHMGGAQSAHIAVAGGVGGTLTAALPIMIAAALPDSQAGRVSKDDVGSTPGSQDGSVLSPNTVRRMKDPLGALGPVDDDNEGSGGLGGSNSGYDGSGSSAHPILTGVSNQLTSLGITSSARNSSSGGGLSMHSAEGRSGRPATSDGSYASGQRGNSRERASDGLTSAVLNAFSAILPEASAPRDLPRPARPPPAAVRTSLDAPALSGGAHAASSGGGSSTVAGKESVSRKVSPTVPLVPLTRVPPPGDASATSEQELLSSPAHAHHQNPDAQAGAPITSAAAKSSVVPAAAIPEVADAAADDHSPVVSKPANGALHTSSLLPQLLIGSPISKIASPTASLVPAAGLTNAAAQQHNPSSASAFSPSATSASPASPSRPTSLAQHNPSTAATPPLPFSSTSRPLSGGGSSGRISGDELLAAAQRKLRSSATGSLLQPQSQTSVISPAVGADAAYIPGAATSHTLAAPTAMSAASAFIPASSKPAMPALAPSRPVPAASAVPLAVAANFASQAAPHAISGGGQTTIPAISAMPAKNPSLRNMRAELGLKSSSGRGAVTIPASSSSSNLASRGVIASSGVGGSTLTLPTRSAALAAALAAMTTPSNPEDVAVPEPEAGPVARRNT